MLSSLTRNIAFGSASTTSPSSSTFSSLGMPVQIAGSRGGYGAATGVRNCSGYPSPLARSGRAATAGRKRNPTPGGQLPTLTSALKNEYTKQILRATGIRPATLQQRKTPHYRMPILEQAGGFLVL